MVTKGLMVTSWKRMEKDISQVINDWVQSKQPSSSCVSEEKQT